MNEKTQLKYDIQDKVPFKHLIVYAIQQLLSVITATILIANICGTPISSCLLGACVGTIIYQVITGFKSPMFISSCGATCSAVIGALAIGNGENYLAVAIGGFVILLVYAIFASLVKKFGQNILTKVFPPIIVGSVTMVIGLNLATFIPTYVQVNGETSMVGTLVAISTMIVIAVTSHYFKGFLKTIPFLIGILWGYLISSILTVTNVAPLIDFTKFNNLTLFMLPDFTFMKWDFSTLSIGAVIQVVLLFVPVAVCALLEHYSDHKVLSNIIGTDITVTPGLHRTLLGDGTASFIGTILCGLPNTSYGESIATTGFSKVASARVITTAAIILGCASFIAPVQVFIASIPSCVFGGCAMILYGFIAASGLKTLIANKVDLENNKNLIVVSVVLTVGVSGIIFLDAAFGGVALAMVLGVILNLILREKKEA